MALSGQKWVEVHGAPHPKSSPSTATNLHEHGSMRVYTRAGILGWGIQQSLSIDEDDSNNLKQWRLGMEFGALVKFPTGVVLGGFFFIGNDVSHYPVI